MRRHVTWSHVFAAWVEVYDRDRVRLWVWLRDGHGSGQWCYTRCPPWYRPVRA